MCASNFKLSRAFILVTLLAIGCVSVNYVGKSFDLTTSVDVYFSKEEIKKEYTVIGHAIASGQIVTNDKIQEKLIEEAKLKGADAILITGIGKSNVPLGDGSIDESQINASFLKYK
ncbi:MAG: hypothetical protein IH880_01035 [Candidatus Marinimicrobia bacterium]|nr:hypothetical protein [Candidatus Neomarinimicrobiota bacterium]MCH7618339.1 hypothetical protein [Candidatus Neomarinimicrobiota bacterium]